MNLAKEAVREGLHLVKLKNVTDKAAMRIRLHEGVLEMHCAYALRTDGMFSDGCIPAGPRSGALMLPHHFPGGC